MRDIETTVPRHGGIGQGEERGRRAETRWYARRVKALLVLSILLATFLVPASAASSRRPRKALRGMLMVMLLAEVAYAFFLGFVFERLK